MPYCQECGSFFEDGALTCSSCGGEVNAAKEKEEIQPNPDLTEQPENSESKLESVKGVTITPEEAKPAGTETSETIENPPHDSISEINRADFTLHEGEEVNFHRHQTETHLGKGLIKPVAIENCMDGMHFKYDEPPRQIVKPEPINDRIVEFRVSGEPKPAIEAESQTKIATEPVKGIEVDFKKEGFPMEMPGPIEPEANESVPEESPEKELPPSEPTLPDEELIEDLTPGEPEVKVIKEPEILWEGRRSWYGLPVNDFYQVTDWAIVFLKEDRQKSFEINWGQISSFNLKQTWFTKLLDIGDLQIIGQNSELLGVLAGIAQPAKILKMLAENLNSKV